MLLLFRYLMICLKANSPFTLMIHSQSQAFGKSLMLARDDTKERREGGMMAQELQSSSTRDGWRRHNEACSSKAFRAFSAQNRLNQIQIFYTKPAGVTGTNGPMFKYFIRSSVQAETRQVGFEKCVSVVKILPGRIFSWKQIAEWSLVMFWSCFRWWWYYCWHCIFSFSWLQNNRNTNNFLSSV